MSARVRRAGRRTAAGVPRGCREHHHQAGTMSSQLRRSFVDGRTATRGSLAEPRADPWRHPATRVGKMAKESRHLRRYVPTFVPKVSAALAPIVVTIGGQDFWRIPTHSRYVNSTARFIFRPAVEQRLMGIATHEPYPPTPS